MSLITRSERMALVLDEAVRVLKPRGAWAKGGLAFDVDHRTVSPSSPNATCWCAIGALMKAQDNLKKEIDTAFAATNLVTAIEHSRKMTLLDSWNDMKSRRKKDVIDLFTRTAEELRKETAR